MKQTIQQMFGITFVFILIAFFCEAVLAQPEPDPAQSADQIFYTPAGNYVRVTGAVVPPGAEVQNTEIGEAVVVLSLAGASCNVILDAIPIRYEDEEGNLIRVIPGIPELAHTFRKVSWPVMISGSEGMSGNFDWNVLLKEGDCASAADSVSYVVSSLQELFPLAACPPWKRRLLRSQIEVTEEIEGQMVTHNITVSSCDPRVQPAKDRITIPHSWAGLWGSTNFRGYANGAFQDRVHPSRRK